MTKAIIIIPGLSIFLLCLGFFIDPFNQEQSYLLLFIYFMMGTITGWAFNVIYLDYEERKFALGRKSECVKNVKK